MLESYLPFKKLHFAKITNLDPDSLKKSANFARDEGRDAEQKFKHSTALNFIAKSLGVKGGWASYQREYSESIEPFMAEHHLLKRQDILKHEWDDRFYHFYPEQISGRLFHSGRPLPDKIFIGDGFTYWDLLELAMKHPDMHVETLLGEQVHSFDQSGPPGHYVVRMNGGRLTVFDAISTFSNLLGDQYCEPASEPAIARLYRLDDEARADLEKKGEILSTLIRRTTIGWAEVIPYNDHLVFLRLADGRYDFFYKNMRAKKFAKNPYLPYLRDKDISKKSRSDEFSLWSYFHYDGWKEQDEHNASDMCLRTVTGSLSRLDNTGEEFLKEYLTKKGRFRPEIHHASPRGGYHYKNNRDIGLCFTDLITVGQFAEFLGNNEGYARHRMSLRDVGHFAGPEFEPADLPAAVTWYDALAYASWRRSVEKLPLKLLDPDHFLALADGLKSLAPDRDEAISLHHSIHTDRHFTSCSPENDAYEPETGKRPDYMSEEVFNKWTLRYNQKPLPQEISPAGLKVVRSPWFSEWLSPIGQAINAWGFCPPCDITFAAEYKGNPAHGPFSPSSDGKYKSMKIGFRLCYQVAENGGQV